MVVRVVGWRWGYRWGWLCVGGGGGGDGGVGGGGTCGSLGSTSLSTMQAALLVSTLSAGRYPTNVHS